MSHKILLGVLALLLLASVPARAVEVFTMHPMDLRAGPKHDYPLLTVLPKGSKLQLHGCTKFYVWCDVSSMVQRGWVRGNHIAITQHDQNFRIEPSGEWLAVPVVKFDESAYWTRYYPNRDFYISHHVRHDNWRSSNDGARRCLGENCRLMVYDHGRTDSSSSAVSRRESDDDHTGHVAYTGAYQGMPWQGNATYDKTTAHYNN